MGILFQSIVLVSLLVAEGQGFLSIAQEYSWFHSITKPLGISWKSGGKFYFLWFSKVTVKIYMP